MILSGLGKRLRRPLPRLVNSQKKGYIYNKIAEIPGVHRFRLVRFGVQAAGGVAGLLTIRQKI
jgi:hypothetical protein